MQNTTPAEKSRADELIDQLARVSIYMVDCDGAMALLRYFVTAARTIQGDRQIQLGEQPDGTFVIPGWEPDDERARR